MTVIGQRPPIAAPEPAPVRADFRAAEQTWLTQRPRRGFITRRLDEYWPLTIFFYGFPVWWVLGLSNVIMFVLAVPMLWTLLKHRDLRVPRAWGVYLMFLAWVGLGVFLLWVQPPGTEAKSGLGPLVGYAYRALWYATVTIVCLYVLNADRARLTAQRIGRMLAFLFIFTVMGGIVGQVAPNLSFPSAIELVLPQGFTNQPFMNALFHPRIALQTDFLGYTQPRATAPYAYPNSWGNAFGLLAPFFVATWFGQAAGWRRYVAPFVLVVAAGTAVLSLNRGLWLGLGISVAWLVLRRLLAGDVKAFVASLAAVAVLGGALVVTPLGGLITLRLNTPHSDDRRTETASEVIRTTWETSPILGYGGTRQMVGNFDSIAGGAPPGCRQCSAPPLGTQGFLWGLIFMTGFVGAALMLAFLFWQFQLNARRRTTLGLLSSVVIMSSVFYFLVYDSLDVPLMVTMITIGLSSRDHSPLVPEELQ